MIQNNTPLKVVVVGGVAGGASAATRARRLSEQARIVLLERGPHVSFANCGLPYHVGGVIADRAKLLVQTPEGLRRRFDIDVRVHSEVTAIDRERRTVTVRQGGPDGERTYTKSYDKLILSPGAAPVRPALPGADLPAVLTLRNLADMDRINAAVDRPGGARAVVVGAGYIGLEMVENLARRGLKLTLVEKTEQVFPLLDAEMAAQVADHLRTHGVELVLGDGLAGFAEAPDGGLVVSLESGRTVQGDFAVMAVGVRPETALARQAGLTIGPSGGIVVNEHMQTSDPDIYAVGDSIEVRDLVTGRPSVIPLAGPANRQGRIAANHVFGFAPDRYAASQGTSIVQVFDLTVALTGASEKALRRVALSYRKVYLHPSDHASYYPGAVPMHIKLLFAPGDGRVLGAQIIGQDGVDKRIDVLAVAVRHGLTVFDLEELELAYAPPYGSAKDAVNMAGFVAANVLRGVSDAAHFDELGEDDFVLDVRTEEEFALGRLPGAVNIPLDELRGRLGELPRDRRVLTYCGVGLRAYLAERILKQNGIDSANVSGGLNTWSADRALERDRPAEARPHAGEAIMGTKVEIDPETQMISRTPPQPADRHDQGQAAADVLQLDATGLQCPGPILELTRRMAELEPGRRVRVVATDPGFCADVRSWSKLTGNRLLEVGPADGRFTAVVEKTGPQADSSGVALAKPEARIRPDDAPDSQANGFTAVVFSGSMDRALAALVLANGAAANSIPATLFFTFWGLSILRTGRSAPGQKRGLLDRMFAWMLPSGVRRLKLSQWHFAGFGRRLMNYRMKSKNVMDLDRLLESARSAGVRLVACQMSMDMLGLRREDLLDGVEVGGVATFMESASAGRISLFI